MALLCIIHPFGGGISSAVKFISRFCCCSLTFQDYPYRTGLPDPGVPYRNEKRCVVPSEATWLLKEYFLKIVVTVIGHKIAVTVHLFCLEGPLSVWSVVSPTNVTSGRY